MDDDNRDESYSIKSQRDLLRSYIAADSTLASGEVLEFSDDGWSGTNFERPGVKALLESARHGGVQCIVVKDLSRWGRNYIEVCDYLEQIFPFLGIRFISVNDRYDSRDYIGKTAPLDIAFSSLVHDIYCKELSLKIHQVNASRAAKGEFFCGTPPYGFVKSKSKAKKNMFEVDDEAATIVRRIYTMALDGMSTTAIALTLNNEQIDAPSEYHARRGLSRKGRHRSDGSKIIWRCNSVRRILADERYTGVQLLLKSKRVGIASHKKIDLPESEWLRFPDSHDAIVSFEDFQKVKVLLAVLSKPIAASTKRAALPPSPYVGKVRCGCCGYSLLFQKSKKNAFYKCDSRRFTDGSECLAGRLYLKDLNEIVLSAVKIEAQKRFGCTDGKMGKTASDKKSLRSAERACQNQAVDEVAKLTARRSSLERRLVTLYEDFVDGRLERQEYISAKTKCTEELSAITERCEVLSSMAQIEPSISKRAVRNEESTLERVISATEVTGEIISLIDFIAVYDAQRIEVRFAFGDAVGLS